MAAKAKKAPKKTAVVYLETHDGAYEPAFEAETPHDLLQQIFAWLRKSDEPEPWIETKDGDYIRWSDVRKIVTRSQLV